MSRLLHNCGGIWRTVRPIRRSFEGQQHQLKGETLGAAHGAVPRKRAPWQGIGRSWPARSETTLELAVASTPPQGVQGKRAPQFGLILNGRKECCPDRRRRL